MVVTVSPSKLTGTIPAIASKSHAHRLIICAALSDGPTDIVCGETSEDIEATVRCVTALGASVTRVGGVYRVTPIDRSAVKRGAALDCGESGSTLRFLLPVVCALGSESEFTAHGRLPRRPLSPLYEELVSHGCTLSAQGSVPFKCSGQLRSGSYTLSAGVSSQYISGLLFALPLLEGDSTLTLTGKAESKPYIDMTLEALGAFGIEIRATDSGFFIPGRQRCISPGTVTVEGDWSNAAFWLCAGALGRNGVIVTGLNTNSSQGDRACLALLEKFGADIVYLSGGAAVTGGSLHGIELDASDTPDLVPIFALVAAGADGKTVIKNAGRLRIKESDRLKAVCDTLGALGVDITETADGLIIEGGSPLHGGVVSSWGDHRIAMTAAIASVLCDGDITITDAQAVNKSYPDFYTHLRHLGGAVQEMK